MAKTQPQGARPALFDRLFPPRVMTVGGKTVLKPRSRALLIALVLIAAVWGSVVVTKFDLSIIVRRGHQFTVILQKVFSPNCVARWWASLIIVSRSRAISCTCKSRSSPIRARIAFKCDST